MSFGRGELNAQVAGDGRISVVVIGRNEGERLRRCLASIAKLPPETCLCEVLYVDSGSSDGSISLAQSFDAHVLALHSERPTAAIGRNAGWQAAQGDAVLFLDGDTELAPGFLKQAVAALADPAIAIVWGHRRERHPEASVYNRVLDLDWMYPPGPAEFCGGDALFRRSFLQATGGFDETLIAGEEPELCRRILALGGKILHIDAPMTGHDLEITRFAQYWQRARRAGHAYAEVSARFAGTPGRFWSREAARNRRHAVALLLFAAAVLVSTLVLRSAVFTGVLLLLLAAAAVLRTAWKARWKSRRRSTLLLYGIHSHFQQVPIFLGQLQFLRNRHRGVRQELLEYKRP